MINTGFLSGLTRKDLKKSTERDKFSKFLPPLYPLADSNSFLMNDDSIGFGWELSPRAMPDKSTLLDLEGLIKTPLPSGTSIQFVFYSDPNVYGAIEQFERMKTNPDPLIQATINSHANCLRDDSLGSKKISDQPLRNYRLFVFIKSSELISDDVTSNIEEKLRGAKFHPKVLDSEELILFYRSIFNGLNKPQRPDVDTAMPISAQVIKSESPVSFDPKTGIAKLGDGWVAKCMSPKTLPTKKYDAVKQSLLVGGFMGLQDDLNQTLSPYIYSLTIIVGDADEKIESNASKYQSQRMASRKIKKLEKVIDEYDWATNQTENSSFVTVIPSLVVFDKDYSDFETNEEGVKNQYNASIKKLLRSSSRVSNLWEKQGFIMQDEIFLSHVMFLSSLPWGFINKRDNLDIMDRHFYMPVSSAVYMIPFTGDHKGCAKPVMIFQTRKGQLLNLDMFDPNANNYNFLVSAESGGGKSFFINYLTQCYYAENALIRMIDIGYSYKKQSNMFGGRFIDYGADAVVMNPFHCSSDDPQDIEANLTSCTAIIAKMAYSSTGSTPNETEYSLIKKAIDYSHKTGNVINGVDSCIHFFNNLSKYIPDEVEAYPTAIKYGAGLAFNLNEFSSKGKYGKFFNGENTFDISSDRHVVVDLERIKSNGELLSVAMLQVLNSITQDLYLSDRSEKRITLFDEFMAGLNACGGKGDNLLAKVFEEGYRRARKYHGSFGVVLQSIYDIKSLGDLGEVIKNSSAFKYYFESKAYASALSTPLLDHIKGFDAMMLPQIKNNKPNYSEIFIDSPLGGAVARLSVGQFMYMVNNTEADLTKDYDSLILSGMSPHQAIQSMVQNSIR